MEACGGQRGFLHLSIVGCVFFEFKVGAVSCKRCSISKSDLREIPRACSDEFLLTCIYCVGARIVNVTAARNRRLRAETKG